MTAVVHASVQLSFQRWCIHKAAGPSTAASKRAMTVGRNTVCPRRKATMTPNTIRIFRPTRVAVLSWSIDSTPRAAPEAQPSRTGQQATIELIQYIGKMRGGSRQFLPGSGRPAGYRPSSLSGLRDRIIPTSPACLCVGVGDTLGLRRPIDRPPQANRLLIELHPGRVNIFTTDISLS